MNRATLIPALLRVCGMIVAAAIVVCAMKWQEETTREVVVETRPEVLAKAAKLDEVAEQTVDAIRTNLKTMRRIWTSEVASRMKTISMSDEAPDADEFAEWVAKWEAADEEMPTALAAGRAMEKLLKAEREYEKTDPLPEDLKIHRAWRLLGEYHEYGKAMVRVYGMGVHPDSYWGMAGRESSRAVAATLAELRVRRPTRTAADRMLARVKTRDPDYWWDFSSQASAKPAGEISRKDDPAWDFLRAAIPVGWGEQTTAASEGGEE